MAEKQTTLRLGHFGIIAVLLISIAIAATFSSPLPKDEGEFKNVVTNWRMNGMSVTDAKRELERNGFKVYRGKPRKQWKDQRDYLFATRHKYEFLYSVENGALFVALGKKKLLSGYKQWFSFILRSSLTHTQGKRLTMPLININ
jgi:hypothetical protein